MKDKVTNEDVAKAIAEMADKVREQMNRELEDAKSDMDRIEEILALTFNSSQKIFYEKFCEKRQVYYDLASGMYKKKY